MADAAARAISRGSLRAIFDDSASNRVEQPVVQCVHVKPMAAKGPDAPERYRVIFSDVDNFIQSMLAVQANHLITSGRLQKGSICRLTQFQPNMVKDKKILIILDLDVLTEYGEPDKIGEPVTLDGGAAKQETSGQQPGNIASNGFYGNNRAPQQDQQQSNRSLPSRPNQGAAPSGGNIYPIEALSPYAHKWTIRARITHKTDIKTWHNKNGEGRLFSVNLLDESGEIRATAFSSTNDQFDTLYETLQDGGVYYISSPCQVKPAKRQFSQVNNDYELTFERDTLVQKAEDQINVPQVRYNFTSIGDLGSVEKDTTIDTIGILKEVGEVSEILSKTTQKPYNKRELTLVDSTLHSVRLTIWGNSATTFDADIESVVAFKGVKVSDFGGRSLSLLSSGSMSVNPDIDEAHKLKGWYDAQGATENFASHANLPGASSSGSKQAYKTIADIKDENLGMSEAPDFCKLKATIVFVYREHCAYPACQSPECNKKVIEIETDQWRCERCNKTFPKPQWRYILSISVADHTGQMRLNAFDNEGRVIMGMSADEYQEIKENEPEQDSKRIAGIIDDACCKTFVFNVMSKMDNYRDKQEPRHSVKSMTPVNWSFESNKLAETLKQYNMDGGDSLFVR